MLQHSWKGIDETERDDLSNQRINVSMELKLDNVKTKYMHESIFKRWRHKALGEGENTEEAWILVLNGEWMQTFKVCNANAQRRLIN